MNEQFIIFFKDEGEQYQAEVKAFEMNNSMVYDVYYCLVPRVYLARIWCTPKLRQVFKNDFFILNYHK